ncbi:MAG: hypothetical protein ACUVTW_05220 [Thermogutta sp.]
MREFAKDFQRHLIGALGLVLIGSAIRYLVVPPSNEFHLMFETACRRMGILCVLLWLAYPELKRLPSWLALAVPFVTAVVAFRPRYALVLVPLVLLILFLRPPKKVAPPPGRAKRPTVRDGM